MAAAAPSSGASATHPQSRRPAGARHLATAIVALLPCLATASVARSPFHEVPTFSEVGVHDPSVVRANDAWYVFGSHLASASTPDWMHWTQISTSPTPGNPLAPDPMAEFAEALTWVDSDTFWAPDVIQLGDGRFYMYYCVGRLDAPRAALGIAVADSITGPYSDLGVILRSGMWGQPSHDGTIYDARRHPNTVDPDVFFDQTGRLWMVYGSYSGGIFILELDPTTGFPLPDQGYGKKLIGGEHSRIEGAFMLYSPESQYYYMFLSFGGLAADGGYNIRVGRSRQPDGPFLDAAGNDLTNVSGAPGTLFDDASIAPYGVKLMGNAQFTPVAGEPAQRTTGYVSPGHNSAYYDPLTGQHMLVFHTRFVGRGEAHEVRVHPMYLNAADWPVVMPHRYAGEPLTRQHRVHVIGDFKLINHGKAISPAVNTSAVISLRANGTVAGAASGTWALHGANDLELVLDGTRYFGVVTTQWDNDNGTWVQAFSALDADGVAIWGSEVVGSRLRPLTIALPDRAALYGDTMVLDVPGRCNQPRLGFTFSVIEGPAGLAIDRVSGEVTWTPSLLQVGIRHPVQIRLLTISPDFHYEIHVRSGVTAHAATQVRRLALDFEAPTGNGLADIHGRLTGLTARLPGTGTVLAAEDPNMELDTAAGVLRLASTQADFFGGAGLSAASLPGIDLGALGLNAANEFAVEAVFQPIAGIEFIDQVGLYVGAGAGTVTRAGTIVFGAPERYSVHNEGGTDHSARFFGFGLDAADGMSVFIGRGADGWQYRVDGLEWNPLAPPAFLDGRTDLVAGVFAITPLNANRKTVALDSLTAAVLTDEPALTALEQWRIRNFAQREATGIAADRADPDRDRRNNLREFQEGTDPLAAD